MAVPATCKSMAEKMGLILLTQDGKNIKLLNSKGFEPKRF